MESHESRYWFLRKNKFYRTTKMAGWSFIYEAKKMIEVIFWYVVILVLAVITGYNLYTSVTNYLSQPTGTFVAAVASTSNLTITNFTLKIELPMLEYSKQSLINLKKSKWTPEEPGSEYITQHYACLAAAPKLNYLEKLQKDMKENQIKNATSTPSVVDGKLSTINKKNRETRRKWNETMLKHGNILATFLHSYRDTHMPTDKDELEALNVEFEQMMNEILEYRSDQLMLRLMKLEQYADKYSYSRDYKDWRSKVHKTYSIIHANLPAEQQQSGNQLLADVIAELSQLLFIDVSSEVDIYLRDWGYWEGDEQEFIFEVIVPRAAQYKSLSINVYTFLTAWLQAQLQALLSLDPYYGDDDNEDEQINEMCRFKGAEQKFTNLIDSYMYNLLEEYYENRAAVTLDTHRGNVLEVAPLRTNDVKLMPTARFISETNACYPSSYQTCIDQCFYEEQIKNCSCYEWGLYYLNKNSQREICNKTCTFNQTLCRTECEDKLSRPCDLSLFYIERTTYETPYSNLMPLFSVNVEKPEAFNHPKFVEGYTYSLSNFMSEIGGLVNFWMGVNLIGIIHLYIYLLKQCCNATRSGTKTRTTIQELRGNKQQVADASSYEINDVELSKIMVSDHELKAKFDRQTEQIRKEVNEEITKLYVEVRKLNAKIDNLAKQSDTMNVQ